MGDILVENSYQEGQTLLIDKPLNWTSFDVVSKIRYTLKNHLQVKKIKVGHAGTLDPLATGLLIICTGKKTKTINEFLTQDKEYIGEIKIGATTPSHDLETEIDKEYSLPYIDASVLKIISKKFTGQIEQIPPLFSAKKIKGKRAYEYARENQQIELKPVVVNITALNLELTENNILKFSCTCSKGTYIRALARDIGVALNSGAHLIKLRRIRSGNFRIEQAKSVVEWVDIIKTS